MVLGVRWIRTAYALAMADNIGEATAQLRPRGWGEQAAVAPLSTVVARGGARIVLPAASDWQGDVRPVSASCNQPA